MTNAGEIRFTHEGFELRTRSPTGRMLHAMGTVFLALGALGSLLFFAGMTQRHVGIGSLIVFGVAWLPLYGVDHIERRARLVHVLRVSGVHGSATFNDRTIELDALQATSHARGLSTVFGVHSCSDEVAHQALQALAQAGADRASQPRAPQALQRLRDER